MTAGVLRAAGLCCAFRNKVVLDGVEIALTGGEITGILGRNGAGKSTLLHVLIGLLPAGRGTIHLDGHDVTHAPLHERCALGLGFLPQDACSFEELTVVENVRALLECLHLRRGEMQRRLDEILAFGQLSALATRTYGTLSGGEKRRVEIAKTLIRGPRWLLLDEPFAALDPRAVHETDQLLRRLAASGIGVLVADHRFEAVLSLAQRVCILDEGKIVATGPPVAIRNDLNARSTYFVDPQVVS